MKKRILAMLLVLCMVMSVMPMTVLAAEANCPGKNKPHTLENCDATLVLSVAAETCLQQSYDLYTCDKCGAMFADNFGEYGPHNFQYVNVPEEEQYSCGAGMICVNENIYAESWLDMYCDAVLDHDFGCDGKCECGEEGIPGHDWDQDLIEITKEPEGCKVPGEATYHCGRENCGATKIAPVYGKHIEKKFVEAVEPECDKSGVWSHEYCAGCDSYWIDGEEVPAEDVYRAPAHTHLAGSLEILAAEPSVNNYYYGVAGDVLKVIITIPANSDIRIAHRDKNGVDIYVANIKTGKEPAVKVLSVNPTDTYIIRNRATSGSAVNVELFTLSMSNDLVTWIEPFCGEEIVYQVYCGEWDENGELEAGCGALVTVKSSAVTHTWILDEYRSQAPSCTKVGYEFWICDDCGTAQDVKFVNKLPCIDTWAELLNANKGKKETDEGWVWNEERLPTCTQSGYRAWACPYCGREFEQTLRATGCKLQTGTYPATKCTEGYTYRYCTNENCDNERAHTTSNLIVSAIVGKCVHSFTVIPVNSKADHAWYLDSTSATCTEAGYELYKCAGCADGHKLVAVKPYGHSGFTTKEGEINTLVVNEPTCSVPGDSYYYCADCFNKIVLTENVPFVHKALMSEAELEKYHGMSAPDWSQWNVVPTCDRVGYVNVDCLNCLVNEREHSITVYAGGSHNFGDLTGKNCLSDPVPCQNPGCNESYKVDHAWSIPAVDPTCQSAGHSGYGVCYNCGAVKDEPDETYPPIHDLVDDAFIAADCDDWGGQPATCPICDASVIVDYVKNLHYVNPYLSDEGADNGGTVKKTQSGVLCAEDVKVTEDCVVDGCSYKKEYKIEAVGHHVNYWQVEIDASKCLDCALKENNIVDDGSINPYFWYRCQYCFAVVWNNLGKDPTCTEDGYGVFAFTCGHNGYSSYLAPLNHKNWDGSSAWVENVDCGIYTCTQCELCDEQKDLKSTGDVFLNISDDIGNKIITDGSEITITVDMTGYKAQLFGYSFKVWYLANALEFVDYEVLTENFKYNAMVHNNVSLNEELSYYDEDDKLVYGVYDGFVSVVGQSKTDGKNVELTGSEDLVAITFKVINAEQFFKWVTGEEMPPFAVLASRPQLRAALPFPISIGEIEIVKNVINNKGKVESVDYIDVVEWCEDCEEWEEVEYVDHQIPVNRLMDADFNGEINYRDAAIVWQMASGAIEYKYAEHLDLNGNGEIDHVDAKLIYQYFVGILAYDEVLNYGA